MIEWKNDSLKLAILVINGFSYFYLELFSIYFIYVHFFPILNRLQKGLLYFTSFTRKEIHL